MKKAYYFEVGIKTSPDDPEGRTMEIFPFDFNIIDENYGETKTLMEAIYYIEDYVKNGVEGTYGVVSLVDIDEEEYENIYNGISDGFEYDNFSEGKVVFSEYKENNKVIVNCNNIYKLASEIINANKEDKALVQEFILCSDEPYFTKQELQNRYEEFMKEIEPNSRLSYEEWEDAYLDMTKIPIIYEEEEKEL